MNKAFIFALACAFAAPALADDSVTIMDASVRGDGCPIGTVTIIATNSTPTGPTDYVQATFDDFIVEGSEASKLFKKSCKMLVDVKMKSGYTLGKMDFQVDGFMTRDDAKTKSRVTTKMTVGDLNPLKPKRRNRFVRKGNAPLDADFDNRFSFKNIGDTFFVTCEGEREVQLEIDFVLALKTSKKATGDATAGIDQASLLLPIVKGSNGAKCDDWDNFQWWWLL